MGLDMYLNRMPRHKGTTVEQVSALESYFDWKENKQNPASNARKYTLKEWCGVAYKDVPTGDVRKFYKAFYTIKYQHWDTEKQFGIGRIMEQVGYWRKANHIHNWFVENIQHGIDDCNYHREVTEKDLKNLLSICKKVLKSSELVATKIENGTTYKDGKMVPIMEDGNAIKDPTVARKLLPTQSGFFFGGTGYDEWYLEDVKNTIDIITNVLETTDFEKEMIYYVSSW